MPRVRLAVPAERRIVAEFLDGLPCFQRGTKKKWRVDDLAARILEATK